MHRRLLALTASTALLLAACGSTEDPEVEVPDVTASVETEESPSPEATSEDEEDDSTAGAEPTAGSELALPAQGECLELPSVESGDYEIPGVGSARVVQDGETLTVEDVQLENGWEHEVTAEGRETEIEFRGLGQEIDLELELENGGTTKVEVCADDD